MRNRLSMAAAMILACAGLGWAGPAAAQLTDYVSVRGIATGQQVGLREGPSTRDEVVAWADEGETLRNLGCTRATPAWCQVEVITGEAAGSTAWIADRYLAPAAPPSGRPGRGAPPPARAAQASNDVLPAAEGVTYNTRCGANSSLCLDDARVYCHGDYHVIESESYAGSPGDDTRPGTMTWYSMNFRCGPGPGVFPNFPRRR